MKDESSFDEYFDEQMKDPEFKAAYEEEVEKESVLPEHSCPTCRYYRKSVGTDPCLECISKWTEEPASKWEEANNDTIQNN